MPHRAWLWNSETLLLFFFSCLSLLERKEILLGSLMFALFSQIGKCSSPTELSSAQGLPSF